MRLHALSALALLTAVACASDSRAAGGIVQPSATPATLTLAVGQRVTVPGTSAELIFERVAADSRCPTGASCIWAGDAEVELTVGGDRVRLHTGLADQRAGEAAGLRLELVELVPQPTTENAPAAADYRLTLTATRK